MAWPKDMSVQELSAQLGAIHPNQDAKMPSAGAGNDVAVPASRPAPQPVPVQQPMSTMGWAFAAGLVGLGVWWYWKKS